MKFPIMTKSGKSRLLSRNTVYPVGEDEISSQNLALNEFRGSHKASILPEAVDAC